MIDMIAGDADLGAVEERDPIDALGELDFLARFGGVGLTVDQRAVFDAADAGHKIDAFDEPAFLLDGIAGVIGYLYWRFKRNGWL
jgi:hypothetical protein